jgi:Ca-activated chloride channel family protein
MTFGAPTLLLGLLLVPVVAAAYILFERSRERRAATWVSPAMAPNLVRRPSFRVRHIPAAMFLIGLTLLLVGFARPKAEMTSVRQGATVVLAIDVSGSMASEDIKPTRLGAARNAILEFLEEVPKQYRVGVLSFNRTPTILVLPSYDRQLVAKSLPSKTKETGTQVGGALQRAVQVAVKAVGADRPGSPHPPASVVLFSDGMQTEKDGVQVETAVKFAKRSNVPISTIALGTADGTVKQGKPLPGGACPDCKTVKVPVDPTTMRSIADATGAKYSPAPTAAAMRQVYLDLGSHEVKEHKEREVTAVAIGLALFFIFPAILLSGLWFRRVA